MHLSTVRFILAFIFVAAFCIEHATAQETEIDEEELIKEYKSSKAYQELQEQIEESAPLADLQISFRLYRETSSGREDVTDSVDDVFLIIEQFPCYTYGANPKISHFADGLGTYEFRANIWDPNCIAIDLNSETLNFSHGVELNPEPFSSDDSDIKHLETIELADDYILEIESTWNRNKPLKDDQSKTQTGTVIGTLTHFVPHPTKENTQTDAPLADTEINIPELDITVDTDRHGNFLIRDVPAGKLFELTSSNSPDTLTFVAAPNQIIDMGKLNLDLEN